MAYDTAAEGVMFDPFMFDPLWYSTGCRYQPDPRVPASAGRIKPRIRVKAGSRPIAETRDTAHLSTDDQRLFHAALRRSVRIIA